jgi:Na+-transporting NADH:ubiquinone oxidoreductase subunit NqrB
MHAPHESKPAHAVDPRLYQIASLTGLLIYGILALDFDVRPARVATLLGTVLLTQLICGRFWKLPAYDPKSALISGLSLCLLLRTNELVVAVAAAVVAIASKFVLRWRGKHVFNPTNVALVAMMLLTSSAWVSPGQWGNVAFFGFLMACVGGLVVNRSSRSDVTFAFIAGYLGILLLRATWLGQPWANPLHGLKNGAFLLFSFFMISDPRTTPDSRPGRILFAFLGAAGAAFVQFVLYRTNGPLWSLALFSLAVPLIDRLLPGSRFHWRLVAPLPRLFWKGRTHETPLDRPTLALEPVARRVVARRGP